MSEKCNYNYTFRLGTFDSGPQSKMRLSSILKYQEQSGELHLSSDFGLDYKTLRSKGAVFVLTNSAVKIHRMPSLGETVTINTWNKALKGIKFFRGYDWLDEKGEKIIEGISAFVLVDEKNHKLLRPEALGTTLPLEDERESSVKNPVKTHLPDDLKLSGSKKILFSMLDSNDHLNNAFYADFLVDFLNPDDALKVEEFTLDFVKEAALGEKIEVFTRKIENEIFINGKNNDACCFRAKIKLK